MNILAAFQNSTLAESIARWLQAEGHTITVAAPNGWLPEQYADVRPHVLLLDEASLHCVSLLHQERKHFAHPSSILAVVPLEAVEQMEPYLSHGIDDYIVAPVNRTCFLHRIAQQQDRHQRQQAPLLTGDHLLDVLMAYAPWAVAVVDRDMRYVKVSHEWLSAYKLQVTDILGHSHYDIFPEVPESWKEIHQHCLQGHIDIGERVPFDREDGRTDWINWAVVPWYSDDLTINGIIMMTEVVTAEEQMAQELIEKNTELQVANRDLEAFVYSVSHDLRAPLRGIQGFAQILQQRYGHQLDERGQHYLNNVLTASEQMNQLIQDLLQLSQLGRRAIQIAPVDVEAVVNNILQNLQAKITDDVQVSVAIDDFDVHSDGTLVMQILANLIDNALTYRDFDRLLQLNIKCKQHDEHFHLIIEDTGLGIALRHHEKIFQVFQRLHQNEEFAGTGIGLSIVRRATELLKGDIMLESTVGIGTTFTVRLPNEAL